MLSLSRENIHYHGIEHILFNQEQALNKGSRSMMIDWHAGFRTFLTLDWNTGM